MLVIPALGRLRQDHKFKAKPGYIASLRLTWAIQEDPISNKTRQNKTKNKILATTLGNKRKKECTTCHLAKTRGSESL
jgi:hypothetical protein